MGTQESFGGTRTAFYIAKLNADDFIVNDPHTQAALDEIIASR